MPESSAIAGAAGRRGGGARLDQRVVGERRRPSRAAARRRRAAGRASTPRQQPRELAHLVGVAGGEDEPHGALTATAAAWAARSRSMPLCGEREQVVEVRARERRALGGRLDLDEAAVAGHDDVRVDLGAGVLGVVEVEQRHAVDDAARDRGDACR